MTTLTTSNGRNASERPSSNPEFSSVWRRHVGDRVFHAGWEAGGSFVTLCNGRWSLSDEQRGEVEHDASPPVDDRCSCCTGKLAAISIAIFVVRDVFDGDIDAALVRLTVAADRLEYLFCERTFVELGVTDIGGEA